MTTYSVNISVGAGAEFYQEYHLANTDLSPMNLTGISVRGTMAKHSNAVDVVNSTSTLTHKDVIVFKSDIVSVEGGVVSAYLTPQETEKLEEGKYLYSIILKNNDGDVFEAVNGLAFVRNVFGGASPHAPVTPLPGNDGWSIPGGGFPAGDDS